MFQHDSIALLAQSSIGLEPPSNGNGESLSHTLNEPSQGPVTEGARDSFLALQEAEAQATLAAVQAKKVALEAEVLAFRKKYCLATAINAKIAELEA